MTRRARPAASGSAPSKPIDPLYAASERARSLGHIPLRQGRTYECWHCDKSGIVDGDKLTGTIFEEKCR